MDVAYLREAFGWPDAVTVAPGPRGALGQIWRVEVGSVRYAVKEIFAEPPTEAAIAAELRFARRALDAGVRLPASHPDRAGHFLLTTPDGVWLRVYDWVDLHPLDLTSPTLPAALGKLLARLHLSADSTMERPGPWYETVPADWVPVAERVPHVSFSDLWTAVSPADPATLIQCHRDLHPGNVFADPDGELVVIDWDNAGPAAPGREIAHALFDWYCDGPEPDLPAMRSMYGSYVRTGGPGRVTELADFSMLMATRLNFLLVQAKVADDPEAEPRHREWAEREIEEMSQLVPTRDQLAAVLELTRAVARPVGVDATPRQEHDRDDGE